MKRNILFLSIIFIGLSALAQKDVNLKINHLQGAQTFALNQGSTTSGSESYNAKRVEYYISKVALEHDGGMVTEIDSFWILVNALTSTNFPLGQFNITNLEAIRFSIGVEQTFNHLDPSMWMTGHPLAPKSPSMHWGWSAGYRFFAMEGKCGSSLNYIYELHSLGDPYYYDQRIPTAGTDDNGDLLIVLNADLDKAFGNITLGTGRIDHGDLPSNVQFLKNVRDFVFRSSEGNGNSYSQPIGISEKTKNSNLTLYPNPTNDGIINIVSEDIDLNGSLVKVYDAMGKTVLSSTILGSKNKFTLQLKDRGYYTVVVLKEDLEISKTKVIVTN